MIECHLRLNPEVVSLCGKRGESMSVAHLTGHVLPNKDGCCAALYKRLCVECILQYEKLPTMDNA